MLCTDRLCLLFQSPPPILGFEEGIPEVPYPTASLVHFFHHFRDPDMGPKALPGQASGLLAQDLVSKATATLLPRAPPPPPSPWP